MTEGWSRRELLKQAGTAAVGIAGLGAAGVSLAGCGTKASARTVSDATVIKDVRRFASQPDIAPPLITLSTDKSPSDPGFIMLATVASGPGQGGTMIMRTNGELVYFKPDISDSKMNFNVQTYQGKPVLTWWEGKIVAAGYGEGAGIIADASYHTIHKVKCVNAVQADLHEFTLTPQGTALLTAYRERPYDLTPVGGPANGYLVSGVAQEIDIATGKLVFEWDSLNYVPLEETYQPFVYGKHTFGTQTRPFDYFHINSLALAPDGDLLVSSRNTWCVYKVSRQTGKIVSRIGGKKSDYTFGPQAQFFWQHHVRPHGDDLMTVFDNGASPQKEKESRALVLTIDQGKKHVTLRNAYTHPGKTLIADAMGSAQLLPDGRMFVGWGTNPYFSEFAPDGQLIVDGKMTKGDPSYRAFLADWTGRPVTPPSLAVHYSGRGAMVYASWNGATEVTSWTILTGGSTTSLSPIGSVPKADFETAVQVGTTGPYFKVQARDKTGRVLGTSSLTRITYPGHNNSKVYGGCGHGENCGY